MAQSKSKAATRPRTSPLRVKFLVTSLPVGGAEILLLNLVQGMHPDAFDVEIVCMKEQGEMGGRFANEVLVHSNQLSGRYDIGVLWKLRQLFRGTTDAVITVGAGDKMFWGRLAARLAGVPVVCSALHSTGWPDGIGRLNRMLTPITDGFIACARQHADFLASGENLPADKIHMIPNGVDTNRFKPDRSQREILRDELRLPAAAQLVGIVAALRPEKNHVQFIEAAKLVIQSAPNTHFVIVGDGPERKAIELAASAHGIRPHIHLLGSRSDTPQVLAGLDVFCLTSKNEANPVSILEALATEIPVVSPDVGSVNETVHHAQTGFLTKPLCARATAEALLRILEDQSLASSMGKAGRELVCASWSSNAMVSGYQELIGNIYNAKALASGKPSWQGPQAEELSPNDDASGTAAWLTSGAAALPAPMQLETTSVG